MRRIGAFIVTLMAAGLALQGNAAQVVTNIEGSLGKAENTCVQPIALFAFKNCNFSGGALVSTELGLDADAIGPLDSGGFYPDAASAPPFEQSMEPGVDDAGVPLNTFLINNGSAYDDDKISPDLSGTITIDDGGDGFGDTNDTIAGTLVIGPAARLAPVSGNLAGSSAVVEEWAKITHTLLPTAVSSATPNGFGGFDYVLGSDGFPDNIRTGTSGNPAGKGEFFAAQVAADSANATAESPWLPGNGGSSFPNWDGVTGTDITRYGLVLPGVPLPGPNPGGATTAVIDPVGFNCLDTGLEPKEPGIPADDMTSCQDSPLAWSVTPTTGDGANKLQAGFDNLVMRLSTNAANEVVVADAYYTTEYPIIQTGDNSWVGGTLNFVQEFEAVDDNAATLARVPIDISVLVNDTNFIDPVTVTVDPEPANGTVVVNGSPGNQADIDITYTPDPGFPPPPATVDDTFTYTITDSNGSAIVDDINGSSDTATVTVAVTDLLPVAEDDATAVNPGGSVNILVLANDSMRGDLPTADVMIVTSPDLTLGSAMKQADLTITYTSTGVIGEDSFTYTIEDANGDISNEATVSVTICPPGSICAVNDAADTGPETAVTIKPLVNDAGLTTPNFALTIVTDPMNGVIGQIVSPCINPADCEITYTPNAGFGRGDVDSFDYEVQDGAGIPLSDIATVTVTVNDVPDARDDSAETKVGIPVDIDILENDFGLNDTPLTVDLVPVQPFNGALAQDQCDSQSTCVVTYTDEGPGAETFTYKVTDDNGDSSTAIVTIAVSDVPKAAPDMASVEPGMSVEIPVLENDSGLSDVPLTVDVMNPAIGSVTQTNCDQQDTCVLTYMSSGAPGVDTFEYTVTDVDGDGSSANVMVTVADPSIPIAMDDIAQTSRNQAVTIDVLENDTGLTELPITVELVAPARNGRLTVNGPQKGGTPGDPTNIVVVGDPADINITYEPGIDFFGSDSFIYKVTDSGEPQQSDTATVLITVVDDQVIVTIPSGDSSALGPWSLASLGVLIWMQRRKRAQLGIGQ